ncbi:TetR/AcrR family transcriptional regulator [Nocardiopsis sediminis]|uniref:TetR/AcrR family transcriptional regulator n=1 Tax=Nocardiopsis sediminis TaxID=1778267 RepID=A0ABV8FSL2_9ACTN
MARRPHDPVWLSEEEQRPRRPRLSRERIVAAAVGLLDAEGVEGVSMRRLAARLDAGTMSLYEYVASKEDLLDLALDAALAELDPVEAGEPWRAALTRHLSQSRHVMRRHPWITALVGTRPLLGPNALARSESVHAAVAGAGFTGAGLAAAVGALSSYVHGFVTTENMWRARMRDAAGEGDLRRRTRAHLADRAELYPVLARHARPEDADFDAGFTAGLEIVLDGIEARLGRP